MRRIILFFLIMIFIIFAILTYSNIFKINSINMTLETPNNIKTLDFIKQSAGANLFIFDTDSFIKKLKTDVTIKDISVSKYIPSTLLINLENRTAIFYIKANNSYYKVDDELMVLEESKEKFNLPLLNGINFEEVIVGKTLKSNSPIRLNRLISFMRLSRSANLNEYDIYNENYYIKVKYYNNTLLKFSDEGDIEKLYNTFYELYSILLEENNIPGIINMVNIESPTFTKIDKKD